MLREWNSPSLRFQCGGKERMKEEAANAVLDSLLLYSSACSMKRSVTTETYQAESLSQAVPYTGLQVSNILAAV